MEEAATQERIWQLFFVIGGDDDNRAMFGLNGFIRLVNIELHFIDFL